MEWKDVENARAEAKRFLKRVTELENKVNRRQHTVGNDGVDSIFFFGCKETAAVKRASLDLSRALTELRRRR